MCVGILTRDRVRSALEKGITAKQIISYLTSHAHPEMTAIPHTISDQLELWEMERNRIKVEPGHLYREFSNSKDFEETRAFCASVGDILYQDSVGMVLVVTTDVHERVKGWFKERKNKR